MTHISIATLCESLYRFVEMFEFFFASPFSDIGKSFRTIQFDSFGKIFESMIIVLLFEMQFSSIYQAIIVIFINFKPFVKLNIQKGTISMA